MYQSIESFKLLWRIFLRNKVPFILIGLSLIYNIFLFYSYTVFEYDPGQALVKSSFVVQGGILASIIIGIQLHRMEYTYSIAEILKSIKSTTLYKGVGKLLFFISFIAIYLFINILLLWTFLYFLGMKAIIFFIDTLWYLLLYWGISFLIGGLIGYLLSSVVKNRSIYFLALIIWLLISPLNYPFIIQLGILLNLDNTFELINYLNIGQDDPHYPYNPFYGFSLENIQWIQRLFIIIILCILLTLSYLIKSRDKKRGILALAIFMIILVPTTYGLNLETQVLHYDRTSDSLIKKDALYYQDIELENQYQNNFKIEQYSIDLNINRQLKADVNIEIVNDSNAPINQLHFLLYHGFSIQSVVDIDGERLEFERKGDNIIIETKDILEGESYTLNFIYSGISSPFFVANEQAIYLPEYFPWLPVNSSANSIMTMFDFAAYRLPLNPNEEINYDLKIESNIDFYTNLKKINQNNFEGMFNQGIYIVSGSLTEEIINDTSVIYPVTSTYLVENFSSFEKYTRDILEMINLELELERETKNFNRFMFIGNTLNSDSPSQQVWINDNAITIAPDPFFPNIEDSLTYNLDFFNHGLVAANTWKYDGITKNINELELFSNSYAHYLNTRLFPTNGGITYFEVYTSNIQNLDVYDTAFKEKAEDLVRFIHDTSISEEKKVTFFKYWYRNILDNQWSYLDEYLN